MDYRRFGDDLAVRTGPGEEIVSLTGTITTRDEAFCRYLHISAADGSGAVFGGHLNRAVVSAACEMVIRGIPGRVDRRLDEGVGSNLFLFDPDN